MESDILEKISKELRNGIDTEAKVLYLLVEIEKFRKAGNHNNPKTFLDFYRDWAVHVELTHNGVVQTFLGRFEPDIKPSTKASDIARNFIKHNPTFFKLDDLKTELKNFLRDNSLSSKLTDDKNRWYKFVKELLKILKDCSIKPKVGVGSIEELLLEVDKNGNAHFKFYLRNRKDCPICKLKWK